MLKSLLAVRLMGLTIAEYGTNSPSTLWINVLYVHNIIII